MGVVNTHDAETRMRGRRSRLHAVAKGPRTMATANDQHKTNYPTTGGFNQRQVLGRLEFHLEGQGGLPLNGSSVWSWYVR
jgi:hypothetical protein